MLNDMPMALPPMSGGTAGLTSKEKAAIVVRLLLGQGAIPALSSLPEDMQTELAVQLSRMKSVDQQTVVAVADEFASEIERIGLSFPGGLSGALGLLDGTLSENAARELRKLAPESDQSNPWDMIQEAEPERLLPYLETEAVEIAAVILSKLPVTKAAQLLAKLPGERARRVTYAVSMTEGVSPDVVKRIGRSVAEQMETKTVQAFDQGPVNRVGAILNYTPASVRDDVLTGLDNDDQDFANQVRAAIFTFANIPERVTPRDVPRVQRDIDQADLALVMSAAQGADEKAIEFILENISKRLAENLRDEAKEMTGTKMEDAEAAMIRIVGAIRALEEAGEIFFIDADA